MGVEEPTVWCYTS